MGTCMQQHSMHACMHPATLHAPPRSSPVQVAQQQHDAVHGVVGQASHHHAAAGRDALDGHALAEHERLNRRLGQQRCSSRRVAGRALQAGRAEGGADSSSTSRVWRQHRQVGGGSGRRCRCRQQLLAEQAAAAGEWRQLPERRGGTGSNLASAAAAAAADA